ncbi:hypothetical protein HDU81_006071 [Chytriomyces hyalinus]|nr:hypothetical protein HDU81_006071 [Chytriomyces hyalinus]
MYSVQLGSFTFPDGDTVIGRGWNGVVDAQLSRKQLRISVDTHAGTLNATRLAQNPSRVRRAQPSAVPLENPTSKRQDSDLPQNTPLQLFHGDTLFLVGGKYPFVVSISRNDAVAAGTMSMTLPFQSTLMHSVTVLHNKNEAASQSLLRSNSNFNPVDVGRDEEVAVEEAARHQEERRWTDDEDDDNADTAGGHHGSKHGARKVRLLRCDFSDESPDVSPFDGESDSAVSSNSPSVSESLVPKTPRKGLTKKPALKRPRKLQSVKSNMPGSDSEVDERGVDKSNKRGVKLESESDISVAGSKPVKSRMPARSIRTRSDLNIVGGVSNVTAEERKRLVLELREKRQKRTASGKEPVDVERDSGEESQISNLASEGSNRLRKLTSFRTIEDSSRNNNDAKKQRRVTAYGLYAKTERKRVKSEHPSAASSEITKILKTRFSLLSNEQKNTYQSWAASKNRDSDSSPGSHSDEPSEVSHTAGNETISKRTAEIPPQNNSDTSGSEEIPLMRTRKASVTHTPVKKNFGYHPSSHSGDGNDSGDASGGMSPVLL